MNLSQVRIDLVEAVFVLIALFRNLGVTSLSQSLALCELVKAKNGLTELDLCRALKLQQPTINKILGGFREKGLVESLRGLGESPSGRVAVKSRYYLTEKSVSMFAEVSKLIRKGDGE